MLTPPRVLFLTEGRNTPSSRLRVWSHLPTLRAAGFRVDVCDVPRGPLARLARLGSLARYDVVVIQKKLFRKAELGLVSRKAGRLVYDFDDAVIVGPFGAGPDPVRTRRFDATLARCHLVIAGNEYLASQASAHPRVRVLPTGVDLASYRLKRSGDLGSAGRRLVVGWIGTAGNLRCLDPLRPVLKRLVDEGVPLRLKVVCDRTLDWDDVPIDYAPWTIETESDQLVSFDIGIMPLDDGPWTRGKCGFKLLQYMASGLPAVASPVGVNRAIIDDGVSGFLADSDAAWGDALSRLARDAGLRARVGAAARRTVEERYSLARLSPQLVDVLRELCEEQPSVGAMRDARSDRGGRERRSPATGDRTLIYFHRLHFPSESGQTIQVLRDYHALARAGESVHIMYRARQPRSADAVNELLAPYGLAPMPTFMLHAVSDEGPGGKRRLKRLATEIVRSQGAGWTVLVVRTLDHALAALTIRRRLKGIRLAVVIELHETALPHMVYQEEQRALRSAVSVAIERYVFRRVDGVICTVEPQARLLDELVPGHAPSVVLPNGVDLDAFSSCRPAHRPRGGDGLFHLRYAGQLTDWKNPMLMLDALRHLPPSVVIDIAGGKVSSEGGTREALQARALALGVEDRVRYVGWLAPNEVPPFLADADGLLLPLGDNVRSRYFTCPMKLFEYAASGVPMIVTRQPTTSSLIEDGVQGLMVEPNSAEDLAAAVRRLCDDPTLGGRLAAQARKWVEAYAFPERARRYREFLTTAVGVG